MAMRTGGPIKEVYFGFDPRTLLIRVDFDTPARTALADFDALRVGFLEPAGWEVLLHPAQGGRPVAVRLLQQGQAVDAPDVQVGIDQVVELAIPFARLGVQAEQPIQFVVELRQGLQSRDRAPREGAIALACPSPDFEQIMWDV